MRENGETYGKTHRLDIKVPAAVVDARLQVVVHVLKQPRVNATTRLEQETHSLARAFAQQHNSTIRRVLRTALETYVTAQPDVSELLRAGTAGS